MATNPPLPASGCFQWNMGAWFGGQIGGTAWMLVGTVVLASHAPEVAAIWGLGFVLVNALGIWLWGHRDRFRPYPALQVLMLVCGIQSVIALTTLHLLRPGLRIAGPSGFWLADEPRTIAWVGAMSGPARTFITIW